MDERTWQRMFGDAWIFGKMIRGVVRTPEAEVHYDSLGGSWIWSAARPSRVWKSHTAASFRHAICQAEKFLGISDSPLPPEANAQEISRALLKEMAKGE